MPAHYVRCRIDASAGAPKIQQTMRRPFRLLAVLALGLWLWPAAVEDFADRTRISSGVQRHVPVVLRLAYIDEHGRAARVLVDAERYSTFLRRSVAALEGARVALADDVAARVEARVAPSFAAMGAAVPSFVDWYLGPAAGVSLLAEAGWAWGGAIWRPGRDAQVVAADALRNRVAVRYREAVLQPDRHDDALRLGFVALLAELASGRDVALRAIDRGFRDFVARERRRGVDGEPVVELDWTFQARRLVLPEMPGLHSAALREEMLARLAGPALGVVVAAAIGAESGAALGAGVGALVGAGVGLAADRAVAHWRRPQVERDVLAALALTRADWSGRMAAALVEAVDAWFDDAIQSLPAFDQNGRRALSAALSVPSSR